MSKARSLAVVTGAYVVAVAVAAAWLAFGPATGRLWLDTLIADLLATVVVFGFSRGFGNSSFYDAYWSVVPPLLVLYWWLRSGVHEVRCWLVVAVVVVWSIRLTYNWIRSFPGLHHEDWRYELLRGRAGRFAVPADLVAIHLVPTLQVFVGLLPAYLAVTHRGAGVPWLAWVATAIGLAAVVLAYVADQQLFEFAKTRRPGQAMDRGLWSWSRHPNYVGEFGFWVALALFGVAADPGQAWWTWIGAASMLAMFLGASIPMAEERSLARRPEYARVVQRVSKFVPRPPRRSDGGTAA